MQIRRLVISALIAAVASTTLTACDPPYPPELLETLYEENPVCATGESTINVDSKLDAYIPIWLDTMSSICTEMSIDKAPENPSLRITSDETAITSPGVYSAAPYYVDAGVAVATFSSGAVVNFSLDTLFKILSGKITTWNDPVLAKENPKLVLPENQILVHPVADLDALNALTNWAKEDNVSLPDSLLTVPERDAAIDLSQSADGEIFIVPLSNALSGSYSTSSIIVKDDYLKATVPANDTSAYSGASQFRATVKNGVMSLKLDRTLSPEPPKGADKADLPYSGVYFGWITLSGEDNSLDRSVARFLLRNDEQSVLTQGSIGILPTSIRLKAVDVVSVGLKLPKLKVKKN